MQVNLDTNKKNFSIRIRYPPIIIITKKHMKNLHVKIEKCMLTHPWFWSDDLILVWQLVTC